MKNLVNYSKRFAIPMIAVTAERGSPLGARPPNRAGTAEGARGLPA